MRYLDRVSIAGVCFLPMRFEIQATERAGFQRTTLAGGEHRTRDWPAETQKEP
jgi:hypothetical protein